MSFSGEMRLLHDALERAYRIRAWHGPNLRGSIRGLGAGPASARPAKGRHSIREIVVHCAYWKYAVARRILGGKRGEFPRKGSNWFAISGRGPGPGWADDVRLLDEMHKRLVIALRRLKPSDLRKKPRGGRFDYRSIISGAAMHDVYHAGQIQLMKRLARSPRRRA